MLSENLERRRQEAEELEGYCSQLKVSRCGRKGLGRKCEKSKEHEGLGWDSGLSW